MRYAALLSLVLIAPSLAHAADPPLLQIKDGDRIVYLGNTFVERDANYGYLETLLTIQNPEINFTFRNLGWSGDTVWGDARARFGTRADGFAHLKEHVRALKPTIILVGYGMNESFAGEAGLAEFESGLNVLLDTIGETKAQVVMISPIPHEKLPPPLPDPSEHNRNLARYRDTMKTVAQGRSIAFVDLINLMGQDAAPQRWFVTEDGIQLTPRGYALVTKYIAALLGMKVAQRTLAMPDAPARPSEGWIVDDLQVLPRGAAFSAIANTLPAPPFPPAGEVVGKGGCPVRIDGLPTGDYTLKVDGTDVLTFRSENKTARFSLTSGPEIEQVEKLRELINRKNELYFHRWRPQNETYLFGFRKHEQGNNAVEIPQFDPLVEELEGQINRLKKPVKHVYEVVRQEAGK